MRIILYLGKGGVGKTTLAAATGILTAAHGKRTLVVSTDMAHSLADCLEHDLASTPSKLTDNLWAQEINVLDEVRKHWGKVQEYLSATLKDQGLSEVAAEEMALIPGMDEVFSLLSIYQRAKYEDYDAVIIDAAPTGETVRLLSIPDTFNWYVNRFAGWQGKALNIARPFLKSVIPGVDIIDTIDKLKKRVEILRKTLTDSEVTSYRLVLNPERMVIKEALRAETYLALFEYPIDSVFCNRVLPQQEYHDEFTRNLLIRQNDLVKQIHNTFAPLPVMEIPYYSNEITGIDKLSKIAEIVFQEKDPLNVLYKGSLQAITKQGDEYVMHLPLPHIELNKVILTKKTDEIAIQIGNFRRDLVLPSVLVNLNPRVARMVGRNLEIYFSPPK